MLSNLFNPFDPRETNDHRTPPTALSSLAHYVTNLGGGNMGALSYLHVLATSRDGMRREAIPKYLTPLAQLLVYDKILKLKDYQIYMLWNDCCNRDFAETELVLVNVLIGRITPTEVLTNVSQPRGEAFKDLERDYQTLIIALSQLNFILVPESMPTLHPVVKQHQDKPNPDEYSVNFSTFLKDI